MYRARSDHAAASLGHDVLLVGGYADFDPNPDQAELFHADDGTFELAATPNGHPPMPGGERMHSVTTVLPSGKVLITGGTPFPKSPLIYDPVNDVFGPGPSLAANRTNHAAALVGKRARSARWW